MCCRFGLRTNLNPLSVAMTSREFCKEKLLRLDIVITYLCRFQFMCTHLSALMFKISELLSELRSIQLKVDMSKPFGIVTEGFPPCISLTFVASSHL